MGRKSTKRRHSRQGINWCNRRKCWVIDKKWKKRRIYCVTFTDDPDEADSILNSELDKVRKAELFGHRPIYVFHEGAERYLKERTHLVSFDDLKATVLRLMPVLGKMPLTEIHDGTLEPYIEWRKKEGKKTKRKDKKTGEFFFVRREIKNATINKDLEVVRTILNSAQRRWRCNLTGKPWIDGAPIITMLPTKPRSGAPAEEHSAQAYPLSWEEQDALFSRLSARLQRMCLFAVNTGTREQEVCLLRWEWEHSVPELDISVFIVPDGYVKNGEARLIVMNRTARSVVAEQHRRWHGKSKYVFPNPDTGKPYKALHTSSWNRAWNDAGLPTGPWVREGVHNLKHTCGRRLRAADVPFETRQVCLGHTNGDITTHYSAAEIKELLDAFERLCERKEGIVAQPNLQVVGGQDLLREPEKSHGSHTGYGGVKKKAVTHDE